MFEVERKQIPPYMGIGYYEKNGLVSNSMYAIKKPNNMGHSVMRAMFILHCEFNRMYYWVLSRAIQNK